MTSQHNPCKGFLLFFSLLAYNLTIQAQPPVDFKGGFFTKVSRQNNLLFGGVPNSVFLERSLFGADSIRIVPEDSLLTISRDSGNWYTITPKPYKSIRHQTDQYDSICTLFWNDIGKYSDSSFQLAMRQLASYVYTERIDKYETSFTIYHLKRKDGKYVVQSRINIPLEVIPVKYDVFALVGGRGSGVQITKEELLANPQLTTYTNFREAEQYVVPLMPDSFEVVSFEISWDNEEGDISVIPVNGNKVTYIVQSQMKSSLFDGSLVIFENIRVKSKLTGRVQKVPSLLYYLKKT